MCGLTAREMSSMNPQFLTWVTGRRELFNSWNGGDYYGKSYEGLKVSGWASYMLNAYKPPSSLAKLESSG